MRKIIPLLLAVLCQATMFATDYTTYLTSKRGFTEVTSSSMFQAGNNYCYIMVSAEDPQLIVGVGNYEAKPDWASEDTKALRYRSAEIDPVKDMSNFFMIERKGNQIGLRNMVYSTDLFQTHDNAGYMYVNTFTDNRLDEWSGLNISRVDNYWLFENGKYPISSNNWACGFLGPWNRKVAEGEPIALNRRNTEGDEAGHYRVFRILRSKLLALQLYDSILTPENGFQEVKSAADIIGGSDYCYLLTAQETNDLYVTVGNYEEKPASATEQTKALRYRNVAYDPLRDLANFFTIEKNELGQIALRSVAYYRDFFQTHEEQPQLYVNSYSSKTLNELNLLTPKRSGSYWILESVKYPSSSKAEIRGYLGPWNQKVEEDEAISLGHRNTSSDKAGHYRIFRIGRADLIASHEQHCRTASFITPLNTSWYITNPSFEKGTAEGWKMVGKDEKNQDFGVVINNMSGFDGGYYMKANQRWTPSIGVSQIIENIPSGIYELSASVASYAGRTVTLAANSSTAKVIGEGEVRAIPVSLTIRIGSDQRLALKASSLTDWWSEGHTEDDAQCFFLIDGIRLDCKKAFLSSVALELPNDEVTQLLPNQWYYYDVEYPTLHYLIGQLDGVIYTTDSEKPIDEVTIAPAQNKLILDGKRAFFKTDRNDVTLRIFSERSLEHGTFTVAALNVDGLPQKVLNTVLNEDGPGSDGTKKISRYLAEKGYDIIGASEDFNYHNSLMESLYDHYTSGTIRARLNIDDLPWSQIVQGKFRFDTDGLNLIWKNSNIAASNESWAQWYDVVETEGNQYIRKGYRHYDVSINGGPVIDVFVLHMDAGDTDATWSRESQWRQLADAINNSDHGRSKLIIGDTNSRWTREDIIGNFSNRLSTDFTLSDVWTEFYQDGIYSSAGTPDLTDQSDKTDYSKYEVVDKILYINSEGANSLQLVPLNFKIEQDYTYGYIDGTNDTRPLGDHNPVVVTFGYTRAGEISPIVTNVESPKIYTGLSEKGSFYTIDGRRLNRRPSKPGVYIYGGRKIIIKN